MGADPFPSFRLAVIGFVAALVSGAAAYGAGPPDLERNLAVSVDGEERILTLEEAMAALKIPSVSIALIDGDRIAFTQAYGASATPETLYQAASLSKFVAAVGAMRLVEAKRLDLDADVNASLKSWKVPDNEYDKEHKVTLRGLLSMTAGINVPGFDGYAIGEKVPNLTQILYGVPPANSPPVTVIAEPGSVYRYSGGSYQIAEALMIDVTQTPFPELMSDHVLKPAGMSRSSFAPTLPPDLDRQAMRGHLADGSEVPGGYHIYPEHAAASLWSTPTDLANLLLLVGRAWRGESQLFLKPETVRMMLTRQNGGLYGLGAAIGSAEGMLTVMKGGHNLGYQSYAILLPAEGKGMVVMTNAENGEFLIEALIHRAAEVFGSPPLGELDG